MEQEEKIYLIIVSYIMKDARRFPFLFPFPFGVRWYCYVRLRV